MNDRGQYGKQSQHAPIYPRRVHFGTPYVGIKLIHTPGDSDRAVRQIDTEMNAIIDAMYRAMGVNPSLVRDPSIPFGEAKDAADREKVSTWREQVLEAKAIASQSPLWPFFDSAVSPTYTSWLQFKWDHQFYNVFTSWEEYEKWLERAKQLRAAVIDRGVNIDTPEPVDLTKTLPGQAIDATGEALKETFKILKWAAIGALGIGGLFAVGTIASKFTKDRK